MTDIREFIRAGRAELKATLIMSGGSWSMSRRKRSIRPMSPSITDRIVAVGRCDGLSGRKQTEIIDATGYYPLPRHDRRASPCRMLEDVDHEFRQGGGAAGHDVDRFRARPDPGRRPVWRARANSSTRRRAAPLKVFWGAPCKTPYTLPRSNVGHYFGPTTTARPIPGRNASASGRRCANSSTGNGRPRAGGDRDRREEPPAGARLLTDVPRPQAQLLSAVPACAPTTRATPPRRCWRSCATACMW